jgi:hypothetical protein
MTKSDLDLLGRIFAAEVEHRLPYQSRAAAYKRLEAGGFVQRGEETLRGWPPVTVSGWYLTHKGRMAYRESCKDMTDE